MSLKKYISRLQLYFIIKQAHAGAALVNFSEVCPKNILTTYLPTIIAKLESILAAKFKEVSLWDMNEEVFYFSYFCGEHGMFFLFLIDIQL